MKKISEKYESFDKQKVENIVKELIRNNELFRLGVRHSLYQYVQRAANKLKYMNIEPMNLRNSFILRNHDYLKIIDKIWEYSLSGKLAPGKDRENTWFPDLHLTEKGKEFLEL